MNAFRGFFYTLIVIFSLSLSNTTTAKRQDGIDLSIPEDFLIGAASSAFQVEGAANYGDKSQSNCDYFVNQDPTRIYDYGTTANVSADFFHKYKEDIRLLKSLGVNHYRLSLSWSRILPNGFTGPVSKIGLQFYHNVIDELRSNNIKPIVTIYHWDHPLILERFGGWLNERMIGFYAEYARVVFREFAAKVDTFVTINEPYTICSFGFRKGTVPPGLKLPSFGEYICMNNILKAHARAYHIYAREFRSKYHGKLGVTVIARNFYSKVKGDTQTNETAFQFETGWVANPIYSKEGDYPEVMKRQVAENSKLRGNVSPTLPKLSKLWIEYIKGTADFFGLNHYTSNLVESQIRKVNQPWEYDDGIQYSFDPRWPATGMKVFKMVPKGIGDLLRTIKRKYGNPPVYIMENGSVDSVGINDVIRQRYLYSYMKEVLLAKKRDGCNIKAYTVWSFTDSFEWLGGYNTKFGLYQVNMTDPQRTRVPRKSVTWLTNVLKKRRLFKPNY